VKYNIHTVHTNIDISIDPSINYLIQLFTSGPIRNAATFMALSLCILRQMVKCGYAGLQFRVSRVRDKVRDSVRDRVGVRVSTFYFSSHQQPAIPHFTHNRLLMPSLFLPRDALLSAVYAVVVCLSVCVCVCVCVCPSHSGIVSKRLNVGSRK